ncbi:hypothetical protein BDF22DRAFT_747019 [Syncephalis plumigaleata]|nr:hypothetical protein BDF22DRAFT_747019 [Syncephalis plumigaleata]
MATTPTSPSERSLSQASIKAEASSSITSYKGGQVQLLHCKSKVYVKRSIDGNNVQNGYLTLFEKPHIGQRYIAWVPDTAIPHDELDTYIRVDTSIDEPLNVSMTPTSLLPAWKDNAYDQPASDTLGEGNDNDNGDDGMCSRLDAVRSIKLYPPSLTQWDGSMVIILRNGITWHQLWFYDEESHNLIASMSSSSSLSPSKEKQEEEGAGTMHLLDDKLQWGGENVICWLTQLIQVIQSPRDPCLFIVNPTAEDELEFGLEINEESLDEKRKHISEQTPPNGIAADPMVNKIKDIRWNVLAQLAKVTHLTRTVTGRMFELPALRPFSSYIPDVLRNPHQDELITDICNDYSLASVYLAKWASGITEYHEQLPGEGRSDERANGDEREQMEMSQWRLEQTELGPAFEVLNTVADAPSFAVHRISPLTSEQWHQWSNEYGALTVDVNVIKKTIFSGGIEPELRPIVWPFLLKIISRIESKMATSEAKTTTDYIEQSHRIEKDVLRTDRQLPSMPIYVNLAITHQQDA